MRAVVVAVIAFAATACGVSDPPPLPPVVGDSDSADVQTDSDPQQALPGEATAQAASNNVLAKELCETLGAENADRISTAPTLDRVKRTTAGAVAAWGDERSRIHETWAAVPPQTLVALCYFDADHVMAPSGGPPTAGQEEVVYTEHAVAVGEDGTVMAMWARVTPKDPAGRPGEAPDNAATAFQRRR